MVGFIVFAITAIIFFLLNFKRDHKHKHMWNDLAYNKWYIPTSQDCKCGLHREIHSKPDSKGISKNMFWYYSDGDVTADERVFKHV